jgi:hypothetical protein
MAWCLILVILTTQSLLSEDSLVVEAELRDSRQVKGRIDGSSFTFSAQTTIGERVQVQIPAPPEWSNLRWICQIDWDRDRQVFVIRNFSWTGEVTQILNQLNMVGESGEEVVLEGHEIQTARFGYIESNQEPN